MNSKRNHSLRVILQALIVLVVIFSAAASVSTANAATPPVSDDFFTAPKMSASYNIGITDMTGATTDGGFDPPLTCDGGGVGEASLWYTYTALASGEATISTSGSAYDTVLTLWKSDTYGNLIEVGCNDDATTLTTTSAMTIALRGGIKYYVEVTRKTGAPMTPPDKFQLSFRFGSRVVANPMSAPPFFYDGSSPFIYYSPVGWQIFPAASAYNGSIHVGNNAGDSATFYFDGDYVQICYANGPQFGNMSVSIDGILVGTIGQQAPTLSLACWDTPFVPIAGSASLLDDNVHKLVLKNAGTGKVNIDTLQVFPYPDFWPPDPIFDLTAATGTSTGKVTLKWTATGDDGTFGRVVANQIRYRTSSFFASCPATTDWDNASVYSLGSVTPGVAGTQQTITLSGLAPGVNYYFMVVGVDEAGNISDPCSSSEASAIARAPVAVGPGFYDDKSANWVYSGTWKALKDAESLNNSLHQANKLGSTASIYFTGTQFRLAYWATPNQGLLDVYVDGAYLTTIDQYTPVGHHRIYVSPVFINGPHSLQVVQQSLPYVNIDGVYIANTTDGGPPDAINDLTATQGLAVGTVDLTWTATGDDPGGVGTAQSYEVRYSTKGPILTIADWELAQQAGGVTPVPQAAGNVEFMTVTGLVPGVDYWFAVMATDDAYYSVLSNTDNDPAGLGSLSYQPSGVTYEDTDPAWYYSAGWTTYLYAQASGGDQHQCTTIGASAVFLFTGNGFTVTYQTKSAFVGLIVYVDGVHVGGINQQTTFINWQRTATFSGFAMGNHTVQFVCNGAANIDAITILP